LHVSFEEDRGGNNIRVSGQCSGNLHGTWDNCLVQYAVGPDVLEAVTELLGSITPELQTRWAASELREWVNESFAISKAVRTGYCAMHGESCDMPSGSVTIGAEYLDANEPVVKEQLQKAGVRLARVLDTAFGN
jgi:S1/P1 Nuclease.